MPNKNLCENYINSIIQYVTSISLQVKNLNTNGDVESFVTITFKDSIEAQETLILLNKCLISALAENPKNNFQK